MDDLVSRQWVIDHLFFEIDKELVRRAPSAERRVRYRRIRRFVDRTVSGFRSDSLGNLSVVAETKVYDDMEACRDTAVCPVNGGPCCHCLPGPNPPCASNIEREEEHHEQGYYPGEPDR